MSLTLGRVGIIGWVWPEGSGRKGIWYPQSYSLNYMFVDMWMYGFRVVPRSLLKGPYGHTMHIRHRPVNLWRGNDTLTPRNRGNGPGSCGLWLVTCGRQAVVRGPDCVPKQVVPPNPMGVPWSLMPLRHTPMYDLGWSLLFVYVFTGHIKQRLLKCALILGDSQMQEYTQPALGTWSNAASVSPPLIQNTHLDAYV